MRYYSSSSMRTNRSPPAKSFALKLMAGVRSGEVEQLEQLGATVERTPVDEDVA